MTLYSLSPLPVHARRASRRAFTLVELIVTIVILGVLAALAIPAFSGVIDRSHDEVALVELAGIAREAAAIAALDGDRSTLAVSDVESGTAGTSGTAADGLVLAAEADANGGRSVWVRLTDESGAEIAATDVAALEARQRELGARATPGLLPAGVSSEAYGYVSYALSADAGRVMLTQRSRTGRCAVVWGDTSAATIDGVYDTLDGQCVADVTAAGDPGGGTGTGAGGGGVPPLITIADPDGETPVTIGDPDPLFPDPDISTFPPTAAVTDDTPGLWSVQWVTRSSQGDSYLAVSDVRAGELYLLAHRGDGTVTLAARTDAHGAVVDLEKGQEPGTGARDSYSFDTLFALTDTGSLLALDPTTLAARSTIATGLTGATAFDTYDPLLPTDRAYRAVVATTAGVKVIDTTTGTELADLGDPGGTVEALEVTFSTTTADPQDMDVVATGTFGTASRTYHFEDDVVSSAGWTTHTPTATTSISLSSFGDYASSATTVRRGTGYDVAAAGTAVAGTYAYMRDLAAGFTGTPMQQVMYGVDHDMGCVFAIDASDDSRRSIWCGSGALAGDATATHTVSTIATLDAAPTAVAHLGGTTYWLDDAANAVRHLDGSDAFPLPGNTWYDMEADEAGNRLVLGANNASYALDVTTGNLTVVYSTRAFEVDVTDTGTVYFLTGTGRIHDQSGTRYGNYYYNTYDGLVVSGDQVYGRDASTVSRLTTSGETVLGGAPYGGDQSITSLDGVLYAAGDHHVATVSATSGAAHTIVAGGNAAGSRDGTGYEAAFGAIVDSAPGAAGNVLIADAGNNSIRELRSTPAQPLLGNGSVVSQDISPGTVTTLFQEAGSSPTGVASTGGVAYFLDDANDQVRLVSDGSLVVQLGVSAWRDLSPAGSTLLATGDAGTWVVDPVGRTAHRILDVSARSAQVEGGTLYVRSLEGYVLEVGPDRSTTRRGYNISGYGEGFIAVDGRLLGKRSSLLHELGAYGSYPTAYSATATGTQDAIVAGDGVLYIAGTNNIQRLELSDGATSSVAGVSGSGYADGDGAAAWFNGIADLDVAPAGGLLVADRGNGAIRRVDTGGADALVGIEPGDVAGVVESVVLAHTPSAVAEVTSGVYYLDTARTIRIAADNTAIMTLPTATYYDMQPVGGMLLVASSSGVLLVDPVDKTRVWVHSASTRYAHVGTDGQVLLLGTGQFAALCDSLGSMTCSRHGSGGGYSPYYKGVAVGGGDLLARNSSILYRMTGSNSHTQVSTGNWDYSASDQEILASSSRVYGIGTASVRYYDRTSGVGNQLAADGFVTLVAMSPTATGLWVADAGTNRLHRLE